MPSLAATQTRREVLGLCCAVPLVAGARRELVVGCSPTGAPFSFVDIGSDRICGAMVDIVQGAAAEAGYPTRLEVIAFPALVPCLMAGKIDVIASAMLRTAAREKVVRFSSRVLTYGGGLAVPISDKRGYRELHDLQGKRVGAQAGTRFLEQIEDAGAAEIKVYDSLANELRDLGAGRIDAAYGDAPVLAFQISQHHFPGLRFVASFQPPVKEDVCLVMRKTDSELAKRINGALERIRKGTIEPAIARWGLSA